MSTIFERGRSFGKAEGRRNALIEVCKNLNLRGFTPNSIAEMINLKESEVRSLLKQNNPK